MLAALYFSNETAYLCFGILVILFLLSILEYGYCSRRNEEQPCSPAGAAAGSLHSLRRHGCRHSCHILQRHLGLQIDRFFPERAVFYLSTALGILLLFASYLPRRSKQWKDDAAVLLSALAFAAAVCGILFSFQSWYRGLLIWGLDLILLPADAGRLCPASDGRKEARQRPIRAVVGHGDRAILF